tara:strand:+ start:79 stop:345 length:267 start_codon:yes stop_codon:yes gene_type:complete
VIDATTSLLKTVSVRYMRRLKCILQASIFNVEKESLMVIDVKYRLIAKADSVTITIKRNIKQVILKLCLIFKKIIHIQLLAVEGVERL